MRNSRCISTLKVLELERSTGAIGINKNYEGFAEFIAAATNLETVAIGPRDQQYGIDKIDVEVTDDKVIIN